MNMKHELINVNGIVVVYSVTVKDNVISKTFPFLVIFVRSPIVVPANHILEWPEEA